MGAAGAAVLGLGGCFGGDEDDLGPERSRSPARRAGKLNVVVIVVDNLRADHVGAYGSRDVRTPSMDALAGEGLRFTQARPEAFPTVPARRAILTGRRSFPFADWEATPDLPQQPGWSPMARGRPTFLQTLGSAGYRTGYVTDNPWILSPPYRSFRPTVDGFRAVPGQVPAFPAPQGRVPDALLRRNVLPSQRGTAIEGRTSQYLAANLGRRGEDDHSTAKVFRGASRWLERATGDAPFALVIDAFGPHEPFDPPPRYLGLYGEVDDGRPHPINPFPPPIGDVAKLRLTDGQLERVRQLYAGEVTFADAWIGNFLDDLDRAGHAEDTLVMLLSDHGVLLGEHGFLGKSGSQAYREVIDVPYLMRSPVGKGGSSTSDFFASTHDVAPTVLAALGVEPAAELDGEDLTAVVAGSGGERPTFTASYDDQVVAGDGSWLLISNNQGGERRLYEESADPRQRDDVAADNEDVADRLWGSVQDAAGGELPKFGKTGVIEK
jgi:arylsulfatase A-like enzyme